MERKLSHPEHGSIVIDRSGEVVSVYNNDGMQIAEQVFRTELTAKSYETYLLHYHADLGFKPE